MGVGLDNNWLGWEVNKSVIFRIFVILDVTGWQKVKRRLKPPALPSGVEYRAISGENNSGVR